MINRSMQPRQMYGLGSLVKKAVKGVKNVIKSPIGKAAILGAVGFGIPGTSLGGLFGRAGFGGAAKGLLGNYGLAQTLGMAGMSPGAMGGKSPGILNALKRGFGSMSTAGKIFAGGSAALSIAAMFPQQEGEDDDTYAERLKRLEPLMNRYYSNVNPNASAAEVKKFILDNTQEYRAMGGRVGYRLGGDTMDREGIKSLEAGAPDVRYTGNMKMASETGPEEFEMDMLMELTQAFEEAKRQGFRGDFKSFLDMYLGDSARAPEGIMQEAPMQMAANGGRIGFQSGTNTVMGNIAMSKPSETFEGMGQNIMDILKRLPPALLEVIMNIKDSDRNNLLERLKLPEEKANGGRIGFQDGSSTGNFGADRYASELVEAYKGILDKGDMFLTDVEKELIEKGEYPSQDQMKKFQDRYKNLEKEYEKEENKFQNTDLEDALLDKDAIKYYNKKVEDLEDREDKLMDKEVKLGEVMYTDLDVSGILKTPEFQEWFRLWSAKDPKADNLPGAEYFENMMFDVKRLRPEAMKTKYNVDMANGGMPVNEDDEDSYRAGVMQAMAQNRKKAMGGGMMQIPTGKMRMNQGGVMERDYRDKGGFVPVGIKEKADDVPAMLSKNEFVMTADAVRGAGGGSIEKGAQRMYDTMKSLERKVG